MLEPNNNRRRAHKDHPSGKLVLAYTMDKLSTDVLTEVATMLSPMETAHLGNTCTKVRKEMGRLAHPPLRVQLATVDRQHVLDHIFYISDEKGRMLRQNENLIYEKPYRIWLYDEDRSQEVNLTDHLPYGDKREITDISLMAKQRKSNDPPRRVRWKIGGGRPNEPVPWMTGTTLSVVRDLNSMQISDCDSQQRVLTAQRSLRDSADDDMPPFIWFVTKSKFIASAQLMMFIPCHRHDSRNWRTGANPIQTHLEIRAQHVFQMRSSIKILSPRSLETGCLEVCRHHAVVAFELWTTETHLVMACECLSFVLAAPLRFNSSYDSVANEHELMDIMYNLHPDTIFPRELYLVTAAFVQGSSTSWSIQRYANHNDMKTKGKIYEKDNVFALNPVQTPDFSWQSKFRPIPRDPSRTFYALLVSEAAL